jgi:hypothetical protein
MFTPDLPIVVKVGYAEAGYGKMMFKESGSLADFKGYELMIDRDIFFNFNFILKRVVQMEIKFFKNI